MAYEIAFAESVQEHFRVLTARERATVLDAIGRQLPHQPLDETRHRKPLRPNPVAPWELRVGQLRVFYEVVGNRYRSGSDSGGRAKSPQHTDDRWQGDSIVKRLKLSSAVRPLAEYVTDFGNETVLFTKGKRAVAALVPLKNVDRESLALSQHPEFLELIGRARAELAAGRTLSLDEMKHLVLPKQSPNKRLQPAARRARRMMGLTLTKLVAGAAALRLVAAPLAGPAQPRQSKGGKSDRTHTRATARPGGRARDGRSGRAHRGAGAGGAHGGAPGGTSSPSRASSGAGLGA